MRQFRLRRAILVTVLAQGTSLLVSMAFVLLTSKWLGPAGKGTQSLLVSIGQIAAVVLGFGFQGALPALVSADPTMAFNVTKVQVHLLGLAALIMLVGALANAVFGWIPIAPVDALNLALFALATISQVFLAGLSLALGDFWTSNLSTGLSAACTLGFAVIIHTTGITTPGNVVFAQTAGLAVGALFVILRFYPRIWNRAAALDRTRLKGFLRPSILGYLSAIFGMLMFRGDIFLVTLLGGGLASAGVYSIAVFAAELALKIPQWSAAVLTPIVASDALRGRRKTIELTCLSTCLALLVFAGVIIAKSPLLNVLTHVAGSAIARAYPVMIAIFPRVVLQSGTSILAGNLAGKGFTVYHPLATFAGMLGVWLFDWLLIPKYGIVGAGVGSCLGYSLAALIVFIGFLRTNNLNVRGFMDETFGSLRALPQLASSTD
jgi:O-antigen/teichoic acid export membrane protein